MKEHSQLQARKRAVPTAGNVDDTKLEVTGVQDDDEATHAPRCALGRDRDQVPHSRSAQGIDSLISDARVTAETQLVAFPNKIASWTHRSL